MSEIRLPALSEGQFVTKDEFENMLKSTEKGDIIHYLTSKSLSEQRCIPGNRGKLKCDEIDEIAIAVWKAYKEGLIVPVQRRVGSSFEYLAVRV